MNPTTQKLRGTRGGFIGLIFLIIVALALLKYFFDWSIFDFLESEEGRAILEYVKDILGYIKDLILKLWAYIH